MNLTYSQIVSERILQLMKIRNYSVRELAMRVGVEPSTFNKILNNVVENPTLSTLKLIALSLDVPLSTLLDIPALDRITLEQAKKMTGRIRKRPGAKNGPDSSQE